MNKKLKVDLDTIKLSNDVFNTFEAFSKVDDECIKDLKDKLIDVFFYINKYSQFIKKVNELSIDGIGYVYNNKEYLPNGIYISDKQRNKIETGKITIHDVIVFVAENKFKRKFIDHEYILHFIYPKMVDRWHDIFNTDIEVIISKMEKIE